MVDKGDLNINQNKVWLAYSKIIMVIYVVLIGIFSFLVSAIYTVVLLLTIIGIPAALVLAKSLGTIFNPVNKKCVHYAVEEEIERRKVQKEVDNMMN